MEDDVQKKRREKTKFVWIVKGNILITMSRDSVAGPSNFLFFYLQTQQAQNKTHLLSTSPHFPLPVVRSVDTITETIVQGRDPWPPVTSGSLLPPNPINCPQRTCWLSMKSSTSLHRHQHCLTSGHLTSWIDYCNCLMCPQFLLSFPLFHPPHSTEWST